MPSFTLPTLNITRDFWVDAVSEKPDAADKPPPTLVNDAVECVADEEVDNNKFLCSSDAVHETVVIKLASNFSSS